MKLCFFIGTYPSTSSITASSSDGFASSRLADKQRVEELCLCTRRHFPRIWNLSGQSRKAKELRRLLPVSCDHRLVVKGWDFVQEESWRLLRIEQEAKSMATFFSLCFLLIHTKPESLQLLLFFVYHPKIKSRFLWLFFYFLPTLIFFSFSLLNRIVFIYAKYLTP